MVNLIIQGMPSGHIPQKFRLLFQKRRLEFYVTGDLTTLKILVYGDFPDGALLSQLHQRLIDRDAKQPG